MKKRSRCTVNVIPFKFLPRSLTHGINKGRNSWLNDFPQKRGISKVYSPWAIILGQHKDLHKISLLETGQYVEVHEKSDNTMKSRTQIASYVQPLGNNQGGKYLMQIRNRELVH